MRVRLALLALAFVTGCASEPADPSGAAVEPEPPPPTTGAASSATAPEASPDIPPAGDSLDTGGALDAGATTPR